MGLLLNKKDQTILHLCNMIGNSDDVCAGDASCWSLFYIAHSFPLKLQVFHLSLGSEREWMLYFPIKIHTSFFVSLYKHVNAGKYTSLRVTVTVGSLSSTSITSQHLKTAM